MRCHAPSSYRLSVVAPMLLCVAILSACRGGDDSTSNASAPSTPSTPSAANTVVFSVAEGVNLLGYVGQTKTVTLSFKTSDGNTATKLNLSLPATPGWQSQTGALSCDTVNREGGCVLRLSYAPTQAAAAATLRLPYSYIDSAGANQSGSVTLNYRALAANAAVVTATPNPVSGIVSQQSVVTIDFATNDGTIASGLSASYALPNAWTSDAVDFTCASFGAGTPCRLTLRYAPNQATTQSSFKVGFSYTDSAGKQQLDAITISYAAAVPNTAMVDIGGPNLSSSTLIAVDPGGTQDVSFTFTPSDLEALSNLQLAQGASLPAGWTSDTALSSFSCASVTQDGQCQLVLHFKPVAGQALPRQTLTLPYTYRNAVGQSLSGSASVDYTSMIYRLYAGGTNAGSGIKQCWLNGVDGSLNQCMDSLLDFPVQSMLISGSKAYLLDNANSLIRSCDVDADGTLLDCVSQLDAPANAQSIALVGNTIYLRNGSDISANLYACPLSSDARCSRITVLSKDIAIGSVAGITSDGSVLYLLDNSQTQPLQFKCTPDPATSGLACESLQTTAQNTVQAMAAGQIGNSAYLFRGANSGTGPKFSKCSVNNASCAEFQPVATFPLSTIFLPLGLLDMKFTNSSASGPALYLLLSDEIGQTRGIVRCALAGAKTSTSDIGDILSCGTYKPIAASATPKPTVIEVR